MSLTRQKTMFRRTARRPCWCAALVCLAVLAGCEDVEVRVWWAPDGSVAAVDGRPGLRLMQPDGTLTEPILDGTVAGVSWLPDGSGLVVARAISVATWDEAKALLPAEESQAIEAAAGMVPALVRTLRALDHLPTADGGFFRCPTDEVKDWALLHAVCARDRHGAELQAAMRSQPAPQAVDRKAGARDREPADEGWAEGWRDLQDSKMPVWELTFVPLADGAAAGPVRSLLRSVRPVSCPAVAPRGARVAVRLGADVTALEPHYFFSRGTPRAGYTLVVLGLEREQRIEVSERVCSNPVWLADGMSLAFVTVAPEATGPQALKTLETTALVADGPGAVKAGDRVPLLVGLFTGGDDGVRLAALPADRLLLAAVEMALPLRPVDTSPPRARLYTIDATATSKAPPVAVTTAADALPQNLGGFAVSPDGTRVAVVERDSDAVAVVDLATGRVEPVAAATKNAKCGTLPAWRNDRELLIQTRRKTGDTRDTWAIWQRGEPLRWLDATWRDVEKETLPDVE